MNSNGNGYKTLIWSIGVLVSMFMGVSGWTAIQVTATRDLMESRYVPRTELVACLESIEHTVARMERVQDRLQAQIGNLEKQVIALEREAQKLNR